MMIFFLSNFYSVINFGNKLISVQLMMQLKDILLEFKFFFLSGYR